MSRPPSHPPGHPPNHPTPRRGAARDRRAGRAGAGTAALFALPALLAAAVHATTLANGFVYDDRWKIHSLLAAPRLAHLLFASRGLTHLVHQLDHRLWGEWAPGYHLTNVVLHAAACGLAALAARALTGSRRAGLLTGLLFAVHPVHVEAVASFANRKEILAFLFILAALLLWLDRRHPTLSYLGALASFALALSAKEVAAAGLPAALFLADLLPRPGLPEDETARLRRAARRALPFLAAAIAAIAAATAWGNRLQPLFSPEAIAATTELRLTSYREVLANSAAAVTDQLRLLAVPLRLCADYAPQTGLALTAPRALLGLGLLAAGCAAVLLLARRQPLAAFALAWTGLLFAPCANGIPLTPFFVAERYLYVPSFGVCLLFAHLADRGLAAAEQTARRGLRAGLAALVLLALAGGALRSLERCRDWRDEASLWRSAIAAGCDTWRAHLNLGTSLLAAGRRQEALPELRRALARRPLPAAVRRSLVRNLTSAGDLATARRECGDLLEETPEVWECDLLLGELAYTEGDRATALSHYRQVLRRLPGEVEVLARTSLLLATSPESELRDGPEALRLAERAYALAPEKTPELLDLLSVAHAEAGDPAAALRWGQQAVRAAAAQGQRQLAARIAERLSGLALHSSPSPR